jgi:cell division septal protein FtsQ
MVYLSVLILASWLLYYSIVSPYFQVREIVVAGSKLLDAEQVRDAARALGRNPLLMQSEEIERSVQGISAVRDARAQLNLQGRLEIEVSERTPLVQWQAREGSFLVDVEGVVFSRQASSDPLMVVRDLDGLAVDVGGRVDAGILAALKTLDEALLRQSGLRPSSYDLSRGDGIVVPAEGGPRIVFGDAADLDSKLATLAAIRQHLEAIKAQAETIDLRFRDRPIYVPGVPSPTATAQARQAPAAPRPATAVPRPPTAPPRVPMVTVAPAQPTAPGKPTGVASQPTAVPRTPTPVPARPTAGPVPPTRAAVPPTPISVPPTPVPARATAQPPQR